MINEEVTMLIARMESHPEEFINSEWDPVGHGAWRFEPFENVRWGNVIKAIVQTGNEYLFTPEEVKVLTTAYKELIRKRCREAILKELVSNEWQKEMDFKAKQLDLPYATMTTNTVPVGRLKDLNQKQGKIKW